MSMSTTTATAPATDEGVKPAEGAATTTPTTEAPKPGTEASKAPEAPAEGTEAETPKAPEAPVEGGVEDTEAATPGTDWQAEARKWEKRAKDNKDAAARLADLEKKVADGEETAAELAKLRKEKQEREWREDVATKTGIHAAALRGSTLEEIEAHAETLKELIGTQAPAASHTGTVRSITDTPDMRAVPLRDQITAAEQAGNQELVATLKAMQLGAK